ncbi:hypothetical protein [Aneurinibacillus terranovensis]|uniref:hypothetical protein n=1 Tax=Aneurinibacillus terranovensis TaxID=278991 RepID=UPI0004153D65|nr:hypothetical protein [Aneurinibacillus terranovensis]
MNFGSDVLVVNGAIRWNGDDIVTVSDTDNVVQQAYLRFLADLGESVDFPDYGETVGFTAGKPFTAQMKAEIEAAAREGLMKIGTDNGGPPWIDTVEDVEFYLQEVDGVQTKMLYAKFVVQGEIKEINIQAGGGV